MVTRVKPSFKKAIGDSYIAAVAIAILLVKFMDSSVRALWPFATRAFEYLLTAVLILDIPYFSGALWYVDFGTLLYSVVTAGSSLGAAWLIAKWAYGFGPLQSLKHCRQRLLRKPYARKT